MPAPEPQAILTPLTEAAIFLVVTSTRAARTGSRPARGRQRAQALGRVPDSRGRADLRGRHRRRGSGIGCSVGPRPAGLHPFRELRRGTAHAPATPGDLLFHIRAHRMDLCFELAQRLDRAAARAARRVIDEVHGFRSFDERDLLGFVDGTENPEGEAAAPRSLIGDEDAEFAGGSYVIVQKYVHDLAAWDALAVEEQERVDRPHEAHRPRVPRRRQALQLARRAQHDRRRGR